MATLWTFGDSFTESFLPKEDCKVIHWRHHYINWKGYVPKVYGEFLSERLGMKLMNFGMGSSDNYSIFESFCKNVNHIEKDDLVIFGWSDAVRFRMTDGSGGWHSFTPCFREDSVPAEYMDRDSIDKILANRTNPRYEEEVNIWINAINKFLNYTTVIHWTSFKSSINATYIYPGLQTIKSETNGQVNDAHFSENGQEELSKILQAKYSRIKNKEFI